MASYELYDLIIIGGGPAGITAGIYAARQALNILLITKEFGGQITRKSVPVENYPGFPRITGPDLIKRFEKHLMKYPVDLERDEVTEVEKLRDHFIVKTQNKHLFKSVAVIIATGADPRPLEVKGEKDFIGKGVSYCIHCDGPLFINRTVVIVGGGDAGFEGAIFLSKYVKKTYILEYNDKPAASKSLQERVLKTKKAEIICNAQIKEIKGKEFVEQIIYQDRISNKEKTLNVDGVFVEIGNQPATSFVKDLVEFSQKDEIKVNPRTYQTKTKGLFACGDVSNVFPKQIVVACGEGAKAAVNAYLYIQKIKN